MVVFEKPKSLANVPLHYCPGCTHGIVHRLVAEAIDVVVFLVRDPKIGPKLSELISVEGVIDGQYVFRDLKQVGTG